MTVSCGVIASDARLRDDVRCNERGGSKLQLFRADLTSAHEQLAKLDRKRKKKGSNDDWKNPHDPDAQITKMKDGRTHLAHKAEHAVDLETGTLLAVTLQPGATGDTTTLYETLTQCGEHVREVAADTERKAEQLNPEGPAELVLDKGYHSNDVSNFVRTPV